LGKVRPDHIKNLAKKLVERFPNRFDSDFENNKKMVDTLTNVTSTKIRNRVAGYATRLAKIGYGSKPEEVADDNERVNKN